MDLKSSGSRTKRLYYPLFLDIAGKLCVVLGGGKIAERKVSTLLKFKAKVKLISPTITKSLFKRAETRKIEFVEREYTEGDLEGAALVFAATDRKDVNLRIKREADAKGLPINIVNDPQSCEFLVPSIVQKGPITVAISTSGSLPLLSKKLRQEIDNHLSDDYVKYANKIGKFRKILKETVRDGKRRKEIMAEIAKTDFEEILRMDLSQINSRFLPVLK